MEPKSAADNDKPHAVFFPFPAHGHVKPAFLLAKLLYQRGFHVTFVHSEHNRRRLLRSPAAAALAGVPGFRFAAVPDGLPPSAEDASQDMAALMSSLEAIVPHFNNLLSELNDGASCGTPPVTCVVSDISSILRATKQMGVPAVALWTMSSCAFMGFLQYQRLIDKGVIPLKDAGQLSNGHLDTVIDWLPGMPKDMRLRDLPSFIRTTDREDPMLLFSLGLMECLRTTPSAIILHTFDELDRELINAMPSAIGHPATIFAVGPLPLLAGHISRIQSLTGLRELREHSTTDERAVGGVRVGVGQQRLQDPVGDQERPSEGFGTFPRATWRVPGGDQGEGSRDELVPPGGGAPARGDRCILDALRVELGAGEPLRRGADAVPPVRRRPADKLPVRLHRVARRHGDQW